MALDAHGLRGPEEALQVDAIDAIDAIKLFLGYVQSGLIAVCRSRLIDHDVQAPEFTPCAFHQVVEASFVRDVAG